MQCLALQSCPLPANQIFSPLWRDATLFNEVCIATEITSIDIEEMFLKLRRIRRGQQLFLKLLKRGTHNLEIDRHHLAPIERVNGPVLCLLDPIPFDKREKQRDIGEHRPINKWRSEPEVLPKSPKFDLLLFRSEE